MAKIKVKEVEFSFNQEDLKDVLKQVQDALAAPKQTAKEWLLDYLSKPFEVKLTKGYITYYRDGQWIFQQDLKNKTLWCYYYEDNEDMLKFGGHIKPINKDQFIKDYFGE